MRALVKESATTDDIILTIDYANAFNTADRALMLNLVMTHLPEIAPLVYFLYKNESKLITSNNQAISSSTGTQQGDPLASIMFGLIMRHINRRIVQG